MVSSQFFHFFSSTRTRLRPITTAGCNGYAGGREIEIETGGDSSSTGMLAMISAVLGEILTANARSSFGSWVAAQSSTPLRESPATTGEI